MREVERVFQVEGTLQTKALRREKANASTCWKEFCVVGFKSKNRVERMQLARRAGPDQKSLWWPTEYSLTSLTTHHLYPKPPYLSLISCLPQLILFQPCYFTYCSQNTTGTSYLRAFASAFPSAWGALSPDVHMADFLTPSSSFFKCHLLREAFP